MAPHLAAHFFAIDLTGFAQHFGAHLPQHLDIPALGLHFTASFMSWAAAGKARVAAVRAARVANFIDVFMTFP